MACASAWPRGPAAARRPPPPLGGLGRITFDAEGVVEDVAQSGHRRDAALRRRLLGPSPRPGVILVAAAADELHPRQHVLSVAVVLLRGFLIPVRGQGLVQWPAPSLIVAKRQIALGAGIALIGGAPQPRDRLVGIALHALSLQEGRAHVALGTRHAGLGERCPEIKG